MSIYEKYSKTQLYHALITRDLSFENRIFVCVKSTNIYCRLSCSARKPLEQNVDFVESIEAAKALNYRACLRCNPDETQKSLLPITQIYIKAAKENPNKIWTKDEIKNLGFDSARVRRAFQRDFGQTFIKYTRQFRLGAALENIKAGEAIINAQIDSGYNSNSGFVEAIKNQIGFNPTSIKNKKTLYASWIETPIGAMLGIVDNEGVQLLEFAERKGLVRELEIIQKKIGLIIFAPHPNLLFLQKQITDYFSGAIQKFNIPIVQHGTSFQKQVWAQLENIEYGSTRSYAQQALILNRPSAIRAIATANGANKVAIIIPCHRVIGSDGSMTGYAGKIWRKEWLLAHEKKYK
jgi:AraC family transcriptional regulator, regulatory protein of adaptative response / methylated-DNA-[protein]-cysteine methyltransferase